MARITVLGGTGYAGSHLVTESARRGHVVTSYSRNVPEERVSNVRYVTGSALEDALLAQTVTDTDVVISALSPRGELEAHLEAVTQRLAAEADQAGVRLGVIGGAGSLRVSENGPRLMDIQDFPAAALPEARIAATILDMLQACEATLDWFYVSPAADFGHWAPGDATGRYRIGGDVLLTDSQGKSFISGADLAAAVIDEIEAPSHSRQRLTVAY